MGFLDKVKEKAQAGLEKGQDVAKTQQLKHELKKLDAELDAAYVALGRAAHAHHRSGSLGTADLSAETQAVNDAEAARDAKQAEIAALGEEEEPSTNGTPEA